jgi:hypothetical protein
MPKATLARGPTRHPRPWMFRTEYERVEYLGEPGVRSDANWIRLEFMRHDGSELDDDDIDAVRSWTPPSQDSQPEPRRLIIPFSATPFRFRDWATAKEALADAKRLGIEPEIPEHLQYDPDVVEAQVGVRGLPHASWVLGGPIIPRPYEVCDGDGKRLEKPHEPLGCHCEPCRAFITAEARFFLEMARRERPNGSPDEVENLAYMLMHAAWRWT